MPYKNESFHFNTFLVISPLMPFMYIGVGVEYPWEYNIGRLRKSGGQKIDIISLFLNKFS